MTSTCRPAGRFLTQLACKRTSQNAKLLFRSPLLPFSYNELKDNYPLDLLSQIFMGGYPRIYDKNIEPEDFFPFYVQTYVERDVRNILNIKNPNLFSSFLKLCASRIAQLFNSSSIANELGVDHKTIRSWLALLEASFVIYKLYLERSVWI